MNECTLHFQSVQYTSTTCEHCCFLTTPVLTVLIFPVGLYFTYGISCELTFVYGLQTL